MINIEFNIDLIIDEYSNYVYKIIDNIIGPSLPYEDKEEIVSDTFYLLWKNNSSIKTNLKSYLASIARNCAYEKLRKSNIEFEYRELNNIEDNKDIDKLLIIKEKLNKLSQKEKELFSMFYLEGIKVKEISKLLHINVPTLKVRLYRLRKKLKEEIEDE